MIKVVMAIRRRDDVVGVISAQKLLQQAIRGEPFAVDQNLQPPVFVPETLSGMELLDVNGDVLARLVAPARSDARGASFVGVVFRSPVIFRVRIISGDAPLGATELDVTDGGQHDLVVMDDFLYGEPKALGQ